MKKKLHAQQGATITAALLFFLVAAVCGSIILGAATATLSRVTTQAEDARAYYSLTSAAQLVRNDLLQSRWEFEIKQTKSGDTITRTGEFKRLLDTDENEYISFIKNLLSDVPQEENNNVFSIVNTMTITAQKDTGETLPTIYAKPDEITYKMLFDNYQHGANTPLRIRMTNDPTGFDASGNQQFHNTFKDSDNKTRQVYWLELTLDSVKVPSGFVNNTDEHGVGKITFQVGWDNASIRKLEQTAPATP